jgi:uncharacterized protein YfaS (alpha-2-macroglobulin family)
MKTKIFLPIVIVCLLALLTGATRSEPSARKFDFKAYWNKIDSLEQLGLPRSALKLTDSVYAAAKKEGQPVQTVRVLMYKMKFSYAIDGDDYPKQIRFLEKEVEAAHPIVVPLIHSMVGQMYWVYLQNNRYRFYNRSKTEKYIPENIQTWSLENILDKSMEHYLASVNTISDSDEDQAIENFSEIITEGNIWKPKGYSLVDFLMGRFLEFLKSNETEINRTDGDFDLDNPMLMLPVADFVKQQFVPSDPSDHSFLAVMLYQQLLQMAKAKKLNELFVQTDLDRLKFVFERSNAEEKQDLYIKRLKALSGENKNNPTLFAQILYPLAKVYYDRGKFSENNDDIQDSTDLKTAYNLCETIIGLKDDIWGATLNNARALQGLITQKELGLTSEDVQMPGKPFPMLVNYRNTDSLFVRIIKTSYDEMDQVYGSFGAGKPNRDRSWEQEVVRHFREKKPEKVLVFRLPEASDYRNHSTELILPALPAGQYIVLASANPWFFPDNNWTGFRFQPVTSISFIRRANFEAAEFCLLDRISGQPLDGVSAEAVFSQYDYRKRDEIVDRTEHLISGPDGFVRFPLTSRGLNLSVKFSYNGESLSTKKYRNPGERGEFYSAYYENERKATQTVFFTDRAIYRPGQTIWFKGIVYDTDFKKDHKIKSKYKTRVELYDANGQKVSDIQVTTNEYGTFNGSFVLPQGSLNGMFSIREANGNKFFRVEEYKRPAFEVVLKDSGNVYKLGQQVKVSGEAKAYSGAALSGSKVKYTVSRQPVWLYRYWRPRPMQEVQVASGSIVADNQGKFEISFIAKPGRKVNNEKQLFNYTIHADVTDINGETHSTDKTISIGEQSIIARLEIPESIEKSDTGSCKINTTNLEGTFQAASGKLTVYRLKSPSVAFKKRLWATPDRFYYSEKEYHKLLPTTEYDRETDATTWAKAEKVFDETINSGSIRSVKFDGKKGWKPGKYVAEFVADDPFGGQVKTEAYFTLFDTADKKLPYPTIDFFSLPDGNYKPGSVARLTSASSLKNCPVLYELEQDGQILESKWLVLKNEIKTINIPVKPSYTGNISVHYVFVADGRLYPHTETIRVPYSDKDLNLSFETFRDKLLPGEEEEWRIKVTGDKGDKLAAEMVATLYDASLDAFAPHSFDFNLNRFWQPRLSWNNYSGCFGTQPFTAVANVWNQNPGFSQIFEDRLNWFGFDYHYRPFALINESGDKNAGSALILSSQKSDKLSVSGKISTVSGEVLPGANIVVRGTSTGSVADKDGNFTLEYGKSKAILEISMIGYKTIYIAVEGKTTLDIKMAEESQSLDEVMTVGYGGKKMIRGLAVEQEEEAFYILEDSNSDNVPTLRGKGAIDKPDKKASVPENIQVRSNFNETAFFYPNLATNENGEVVIKFKIPESLTRWKMLGFAHTKDLKYGFIENSLVTAKKLMVVPNLPRFFREGDQITLSSKITNLSEENLDGSVVITLSDPFTGKPIDSIMQKIWPTQNFMIPAGQSKVATWTVPIPQGLEAVSVIIVATAGNFIDGQENFVPVLPNRMLVTETLPVWIKGGQSKSFELSKLAKTTSPTRKNFRLSFELTSNPTWLAVQSLPYLMEYPFECMEQTFSRLYANSIATYIANSNPKIKAVFDAWKAEGTGQAFLSKLEKNQELKQVILQETPWVLEAQNQSERNRRIAQLFDLSRMNQERQTAIQKLKEGQYPSGGWPWFAGGPESRFITAHIVAGFGHLQKLGVYGLENEPEIETMLENAVGYLDREMLADYQKMVKDSAKNSQPKAFISDEIVHYLYARSYFKDIPLDEKMAEAVHFYKSQFEKYWPSQSRYMQGMIALTLWREGNQTVAQRIVRSLKEFATVSDEMGMYWKEPWGYRWYLAPIETQALMIEVFDEISGDEAVVDNLRTWLVRNKQANDWRTTKATTEACYALLLRGTDWLDTGKNDPDLKVEAGTGYFKKTWGGGEIKPEMAKVELTKPGKGISWGSLYWQYFEQLDKITPASSPLAVSKKLFRETASKKMEPVESGNLKVGDKVIVRIELSTSQDMEFIHLKDMRASCFEPLETLSGYRYQDGVGYYQAIKDASMNFFFETLPKGEYVFEYPLWVSNAGNFSNGITSVQSMYAPEFGANSEGVRIIIP